MNSLQAAFAEPHEPGRKALLPYITAGYPDLATTIAILRRMDPDQCACIELGIPFSDPIADGPVIQTSFSRALESGFRLEALLEALGSNREQVSVPLVAMVSYSIVYRRSPADFVAAASEAGISGLIVPDLPIEESHDLSEMCRARACPLVMIASPTSDPARRRRIAEISQPFTYYQSLAGVTGERDRLADDLLENVKRLKGEVGKPVCVGFGISTPGQVAEVCSVADGAIVGSAIVRRMNSAVDQGRSRDEIVQIVVESVEYLMSDPA